MIMTIVTIQLPEVKEKEEERPSKCPNCPGKLFQRWGKSRKRVKDTKIKEVNVYRYRCCLCHRTFRHYPEGISQAQQTERLKALAAIGWRLGLSYRGISQLYSAFGVDISRMTAWRDVQLRAKRLRKSWSGKTTRVVGIDGAYVLGPTGTEPVLVLVDMGTGEPITLGYIDEKDPQAVENFLKPLVEEYGISVIVTDGLKSYKTVSNNLNLEHQECHFHLRRWVNRQLKEFEKSLEEIYQPMVKEAYQIMNDLPPEGDKRLLALYRQLPQFRQWKSGRTMSPLERFRLLLIRLSENWERFCVFQWHDKVPWTNNLSEQCICKMKVRSRTVRGYKSIDGMLNGLLVAGSFVS